MEHDEVIRLASEIDAAFIAGQIDYETRCKVCKRFYDVPLEKRAELWPLLSFDKSQARCKSKVSKHARIGANEYLWTPAIKVHHTGAYTIEYEAAQLTNDQLDDAIARGFYHSDCSYEDIATYKASVSSKRKVARKRRLVAMVMVDLAASKDTLARLEVALAELEKVSPSVKINRSEFDREVVKYKVRLERRLRANAVFAVQISKNDIPRGKIQELEALCRRGSNAEIAHALSVVGSNFDHVKDYTYKSVDVPPIVQKRCPEAERKTWIELAATSSLVPFLDEPASEVASPGPAQDGSVG